MNIFELHVRKSLELMDEVMRNVGLREITMSDRYILTFDFLSTYDGAPYKRLLCHNVWKINYNTAMESADEFPCFILDVKQLRLEGEQIKNAFTWIGYAYSHIPISSEYNLLSITGGDTDIDLICGKIEVIEPPYDEAVHG